MSVFVRAYATIDPPDAGRAFLARVITREAVLDDKGQSKGTWREGFSVCFYGATADEATSRADAWIEAKRTRQIEIEEGRAAAAEKRRSR